MHQIEAVLNHIDGRDQHPAGTVVEAVVLGPVCGQRRKSQDRAARLRLGALPAEWESDYDWANPRFVETDMDDWKPDRSGRKARMNCDRWGGDSLRWFVYWMQHLPGPATG